MFRGGGGKRVFRGGDSAIGQKFKCKVGQLPILYLGFLIEANPRSKAFGGTSNRKI